MRKTRHIQIDKIRITKLSPGGYGEKVVRNPDEISRIVTLVDTQGEECPHYVHSPQITTFRIELYKGPKLLARIGVAGDFVYRDNEWYYVPNSSLEEELVRHTEDVALTKVTCTFA